MNGDKKTIAIIGNPNSGKTTLFNRLTGSNQHVGNWPGVTVDRKTGHICHDGAGIDIVDLPGIYSLSPYTPVSYTHLDVYKRQCVHRI